MKNKRMLIIIIIVSLVTICISLFTYIKVNNIKKLKGDVTEPAYKRAGFESKEIYQCVIDEYNKMPDHGNDITVDTYLTDDELSSVSNKYTRYELSPWLYTEGQSTRTYNALICNLKEEAHDKEINLQGLDKLNSATKIIINGTAKKIIADGALTSYKTNDHGYNNFKYLGLATSAEEIVLKNNNIFLDVGTNSTSINNLTINNNLMSYSPIVYGNYEIININNNIYDNYEDLLVIDANINNLIIKNNSLVDAYDEIESTGFEYLITKNDDSNNFEINNLTVENIDVNNINLSNFNLESVRITDALHLNTINISNNNLTTVELANLPELSSLNISNNYLTSVDLSNFSQLRELNLSSNNLTDIDLSNISHLNYLNLSKNKLTSIDLSKTSSQYYSKIFYIDNNPFEDAFNYIIKDKEYNLKSVYNDTNPNYSININGKLKIEGDKLQAKEEGYTSFTIDSNKINKAILFLVNVYDVKSEEYNVDKGKKEIEYTDTFNKDKVYVTEGFTVNIEDDNFVISNDEDYVDTFKLVKKESTTKTTTTKKNDSNSSNIISNAIDGIKSFITGNNSNQVKKDNNIYINGTYIKSRYLRKVRGYNKNIILNTNEGITFIVNGLDIKDSSKDIDLEYIFINLNEYAKKEEIKDKIDSGYILKFKTIEELPFKLIIEISYNEVNELIEKEKVNVYKYDGKYELITNNNSFINNKLSFYIDDTLLYIITNNKIKEKTKDVVYKTKIYKDNEKLYIKKLDYKYNDSINKKSNVVLVTIIINTILLVTLIILITIFIKKNNKGGDNI